MYLKIHARSDILVAGPKFTGHSFVNEYAWQTLIYQGASDIVW